MMKLRFLLIIFMICFLGRDSAFGAVAPTSVSTPAPVVQPAVDFAVCNKIFKIDSQKLFYLTLSSINANRFTITEIQSKSGYVMFSVGKRQFLAKIVNIQPSYSMLKITPCDSNYIFPIGIVQNCFKYIELNLDTPIEKLSVI